MTKTEIVICCSVVLAVVGGCGSKESNAPDPPLDLRPCSLGTWIRADRPCTCPAGFMFNTPECAALDCAENDALVLREDGTSLDFTFRRSDALNSVSAVGARGGVVEGTWSLSGHELAQTFGTRVYATDVTCGSNVLSRPGNATYTRTSPQLAGAFELAARSSWTTVPLRRP